MARLFVVFAALASLHGPAYADQLKSMTLANNLGSVLGSEELCNLSFNQDAITAFIEQNVAADDMNFASTLQLMIGGTQYSFGQMSASARTAHCVQIRRVAVSYGFVAN